MSTGIGIHAYVVGFGDCILLTLPDGGKARHVLVDLGRAPNDASSLERFPPSPPTSPGDAKAASISSSSRTSTSITWRASPRARGVRQDAGRPGVDGTAKPPGLLQEPSERRGCEKKIREAVFRIRAQCNAQRPHVPPGIPLAAREQHRQRRPHQLPAQARQEAPVYLARGRQRRPATRGRRTIHIEVLAPEEEQRLLR